MEQLYKFLGISRQGALARIRHLLKEHHMMEQIQLQVYAYREGKDCRAGSRNLYHNLGIKSTYAIGVNKFERLMSTYHLTMRPLKMHIVTTQSTLQSWNYNNLVNGLEVNDVNQVVVGDLTYIKLGTKVFYLFCLTDLYSARVVGACVSDRMRAQDALNALLDWIDLRGSNNIEGCIHHTDGGGQYFSKEYLEVLASNHTKVSVAKTCIQNGYAEQRNCLIKHHLLPTKEINSLAGFHKEIEESLYFYNYQRKQEGLGWRAPVEFEMNLSELPKKEHPKMKLHDFANYKRGFPRHMSTKS
jgi:transposase InsO family protein